MTRLELEMVIDSLELEVGCAKVAIAMAQDSHDVLVQQTEIRRLRKRIEYVERKIAGLAEREKLDEEWCRAVVAGPPALMDTTGWKRLEDLDVL